MEYREMMRARMEPDVYSGQTCDQIKPGWKCSAEGDMDEESGLSLIELSAKTFPAGTEIKISVPCCPECGMDAPDNPEPCWCGFDWKAWIYKEFS